MVTLGNEEILIAGGHDKLTNISSIIPEILKKDLNGRLFWKPLTKQKVMKFLEKKMRTNGLTLKRF